MPDDLQVTAETDDGLVMGLAHKTLPLHGVQFHPESIASEHGHLILQNFLDLARSLERRARRDACTEGQRMADEFKALDRQGRNAAPR